MILLILTNQRRCRVLLLLFSFRIQNHDVGCVVSPGFVATNEPRLGCFGYEWEEDLGIEQFKVAR